MNGGLPVWAMEPRTLGSYTFPGLPPAPEGLEEVWLDLEYAIQGLLLRLRQRLGKKLTASVRAVADQADQDAIAALLTLAERLA